MVGAGSPCVRACVCGKVWECKKTGVFLKPCGTEFLGEGRVTFL